MDEVTVVIEDAADWAVAEEAARSASRELGMTAVNQVCLIKALQAAMADVLTDPGRGLCIIRDDSDAARLRLRVQVEGSPDALADSMELDLAQRLVEDFRVDRERGRTTVSFALSQHRARRPLPQPFQAKLTVLREFEDRP